MTLPLPFPTLLTTMASSRECVKSKRIGIASAGQRPADRAVFVLRGNDSPYNPRRIPPEMSFTAGARLGAYEVMP